MGFSDFFNKDVETRDTHDRNELKTHYYRCEYRIAKEAFLRYCKEHKWFVKNVDDNYGEIFIENSSNHLIISIRRAHVIQVSVDIKVSVYNFIAANKPYKIVKDIYAFLDKQLPFAGTGQTT